MLSQAITLLAIVGVQLTSAAPPKVPGFNLTWSDDFIGTANSLPNLANWIVDVGTSYPGGAAQFGTGEIQTYTSQPGNLRLTGDGRLQITPLREGTKWTSARIETKRTDFQARVGGKMRISARLAMPDVSGPAASGYWPAFWTLGDKFRNNYQNWPSIGEMDIMENVNGVNSAWGTLHCGVNPGGPCKETDGLSAKTTCPGSPCQGNMHIYTIEVDRSSKPEKLTWSVDGVSYHSVKETDLPGETWGQTVYHGHFILLNLAMGGSFPNNQQKSPTPTEQTKPGVPLYVDWVAVYNA